MEGAVEVSEEELVLENICGICAEEVEREAGVGDCEDQDEMPAEPTR